tara:strand:+ start:1198 stop:1869 length:672 start_codon:yes stop_codon:yes gene_type:complete
MNDVAQMMNDLDGDDVFYSGDDTGDEEEEQETNEQEVCSICFCEMTENCFVLDCNHKFHTNCIVKWFRSKQDSCPLCRVLPTVKMRTPDVFHRAKTLIRRHTDGSIEPDAFITSNIEVITEAERRQAIEEEDLRKYREFFKTVTKPRKDEILKKYRELRKKFKQESIPLLKQLDDIDERDRHNRKQIVRSIREQKKKKRQAMRNIGLYNIESSAPIGLVSSES